MNNISIADYLKMREILDYLTEQKDELIRENNGYTNLPIERLKKLIDNLESILNKLEKD